MDKDDLRTAPDAVKGGDVAQKWANSMGTYAPEEYRRTSTKRSLFPHQRNIIEYAGSVLENWQETDELLRRGLLAFHNVGAGKTIEMLGIMLMAGIHKPDAMVVFMGTTNQIENLFMNGDLMEDYNSMAIPDRLKLRAGCPLEMAPDDARVVDTIPLPRYQADKYPKARKQRALKCGVLDPERFGYVTTPSGRYPRVIGITIVELARHIIQRCRMDGRQWGPCQSHPPGFTKEDCRNVIKSHPPNLQKSGAWLPIDFSAIDSVVLFDEAHNLQKPPVSRAKTCNAEVNALVQYYYAQQFLLDPENAYRSYLVLMTSTPANSVEDFLSFSKLLVFPDRYPRLDDLIHRTQKANGTLLQEVLDEWSFLVEGTIDAFNALNNFCIYPRIVFKNTGQTTSPFDSVEGVESLVNFNPRFTQVDVLKQLLDPTRVQTMKPQDRKVRRLYFGAFNPQFDPKLDRRKNGSLTTAGFNSAFRSQGKWFTRLLTRDFVATGLRSFSPKLHELLRTVTAARAPEMRGKQLIACSKTGKYNPAYAVEAGLASGGAGEAIERLDVLEICRKAGVRGGKTTARAVRDALVAYVEKEPPRRRFFSLNFTKTDVSDDLRPLLWAAIRSNDSNHPGVFNLPGNANGELLEILVLNDPPDFEGTSLRRLRYIHVFDVFPMDTFGQIIGRGQRPFAYLNDAPDGDGECGAFSPGTIEIAVYVNQWPEVEQRALFASFARRLSTAVLDGTKPWVKKLKRRLTALASHPRADVAADARDALQHLGATLSTGARERLLRDAYGRAGENPTLERFLAEVTIGDDVTQLQAQRFFIEQQNGDGSELGSAMPVDAADLLSSFRKNLDIMKMYIQAMKISSNCYRMQAVHQTYGGLPAGAGIAPPGQRFVCAAAGKAAVATRPTTEAVTLDIKPVIRRNGFLGPAMAVVSNRLYSMLGWTTAEELFDKQYVMQQMKSEFGDQAPAAYETFVGIVTDLLQRT